ncbi:MAG: uracil-DNA glycosylase [Asgard group archaeon]|nr:uracil-DNA glycosylase [Asgard group archaeon]
MKINTEIKCNTLPCEDVKTECYLLPEISLDTSKIKVFMIAEAVPENQNDYFYANKTLDTPAYLVNTIEAFNQAGLKVKSVEDIIDYGFYLTAAIKCAKKNYRISAKTIKQCSFLLELELQQFNNLLAIMLMGDSAIKCFNYIAKRTKKQKIIPSEATYKIRKKKFYYGNIRVFPSYLMTGKNYLIEKTKQRMIAEDLQKVIKLIMNK